MIKFTNSKNVFSFFDDLFKYIEQDKTKNYLNKYSKIKYNQIIEQHKYYLQLKEMNEGKDIIFDSIDIICFLCINESLSKKNGIMII